MIERYSPLHRQGAGDFHFDAGRILLVGDAEKVYNIL